MKIVVAVITLAAVLAVAAAAVPHETQARLTHAKTRAFVSRMAESDPVANYHAKFAQDITMLTRVIEEIDNVVAGKHATIAARDVSAECQAAKDSLQATLQSDGCKLAFAPETDPVVTIWEETDIPTLRTKVATFCESTCRTDVRAGFESLLQTCTLVELFVELDIGVLLRTIRVAATAPCLQFRGTYCFPEFVNFGRTFDNNPTLTEDNLNIACVPCVRRYIILAVALYGDDQDDIRNVAAMFEFICTKSEPGASGRYCILEFERINALKATTPPPSESDLFKEMCSTNCIARLGLIARAFNVTGFGNEDFRSTQLLCFRNEEDELCLIKTFEIMPTLPQTCPDTTCAAPCDAENPSTCPNQVAPYCSGDNGNDAQRAEDRCDLTACGPVIDDFISKAGCCSQFIFDIQETPAERAAWRRWATAAQPNGCGKTMNGRCPGEVMRLVLRLTNLRAAWINANINLIREAILLDLAANSGVDPSGGSNFEVSTRSTRSIWPPSTWFARATNEVTISMDLQAGSSTEAGAASRALAQGELAAPNTAKAVGNNVADQNSGVGVTVDSQSCSSCVSSPALATAPSALVFVLAALASLALFL